MSKKADDLRAKGICNTHLMLAPGELMIADTPRHNSRSPVPLRWRVCRNGEDFPGPWYDHGAKSFSYYNRSTSAAALQQALDFAAGINGEEEWARSPFGDLIPLSVLARHGIKPGGKIYRAVREEIRRGQT